MTGAQRAGDTPERRALFRAAAASVKSVFGAF